MNRFPRLIGGLLLLGMLLIACGGSNSANQSPTSTIPVQALASPTQIPPAFATQIYSLPQLRPCTLDSYGPISGQLNGQAVSGYSWKLVCNGRYYTYFGFGTERGFYYWPAGQVKGQICNDDNPKSPLMKSIRISDVHFIFTITCNSEKFIGTEVDAFDARDHGKLYVISKGGHIQFTQAGDTVDLFFDKSGNLVYSKVS